MSVASRPRDNCEIVTARINAPSLKPFVTQSGMPSIVSPVVTVASGDHRTPWLNRPGKIVVAPKEGRGKGGKQKVEAGVRVGGADYVGIDHAGSGRERRRCDERGEPDPVERHAIEARDLTSATDNKRLRPSGG
jgi:hypothetical protein